MPIDPSLTAIFPIQDSSESLKPQASQSGAKEESQDSPFGPAYVLELGIQTAASLVAVATVPFVGTSAAQALADLPPLKSMGVADLTELSLQHLLDPSAADNSGESQ
jgi:hypothetical protein